MRVCVLFFLSIFLLRTQLFCISSYTITTDTQFNLFSKEKVSVLGEGQSAILLLNNHFKKLQNVFSPPKRHSYAFDYSSTTKKVLLFGGVDDENYPLKIYNDCWIFDVESSSWVNIKVSSAISARYGHSLVNIGSDKFLLFGGLGSYEYYNDTYIFSFTTNKFQLVETSTSPSKRYYHSMCFVPEENKVYLFGGFYAGVVLDDLWCFDIKTLTWQKILCSNPPQPRWGHKMLYSSKNKKIYIIGGQDYTSTGLFNDIWEYDPQTNIFIQIQTPQQFLARSQFAATVCDELNFIMLFGGYLATQEYTNEVYFYNCNTSLLQGCLNLNSNFPTARNKFQLTYIKDGKFLTFAGSNGIKPLDDTYIFCYSTYGVVLSDIIYIYNPTQLYYKQLSFLPTTLPDGAEIKFQISYSTDGKSFSDFLGPDGTINTFFTIYQQNFSSNVFNNKKFIKLKGIFSTAKPPNNPYVDDIMIKFNLAPYSPNLSFPINRSSLNTLTPTFSWQPAGDPDGDTNFSYHFQLSKNTNFTQLVEDIQNYPNTFYTTLTPLQTGIYFWRVSCKDSDEGSFSEYFTVEIDTTSPAPPSYIKAYTGTSNNQLVIETRITGDDGNVNDFSGKVIVAYSSFSSILTENDFEKASKYIYKPPKQPPNSFLNFTLDGLQNNTTYYINIKLEDEAGNLSKISTVSCTAITNFNPSIKIISPTENSVIQGDKVEISWYYYDYNPEDSHRFEIFLSTDNSNFSSISPTLGDKTTYYIWNSLSVRNDIYFLKIVVYDQRNAKGEDIIKIQVSNSNFPPKILSWEYPKKGDILVGVVKINWSMYDPNLADTHTYKLYISTDAKNFTIISEINNDTTFYFLDTTQFINGHNYRLKIFITDGEFTDELISESFSIKNNNYPPTKPQLIYPKHLSFASPYKIKFQWQQSIDYNPNDKVFYDFYLSTQSNFNSIVFSTYNLTQTYIELKQPIIQPEQNYFWYIKAKDIFEDSTTSDIFMFKTLSKYKAISEDYKVYAELLEIPQQNYFIYISKLCEATQRATYPAISLADKKDNTDRLIKVIPTDVYEVNVYDEEFQEVKTNLKYKLVVSVDDNIENKQNIKVAYLNKEDNNWTFRGDRQYIVESEKYNLVNKNSVELISSQYGCFTLVEKDTTYEVVSHIIIYPNPFDPLKEKVTFEYILTKDCDIELYILTLSGGVVKKFEFQKGQEGISKGLPEGKRNSIIWDGKNSKDEVVASGMYICKFIFDKKIFYKYLAVTKR